MSEARWALGEFREDGVVTLVGYRQDIPGDLKGALPRQFIVEWKFSQMFPGGLPTEEALAPALALQAKVTPVMEAHDDAVLAIVSTGHGYREMYFYCRDPILAQERFNSCVQGEDLPVELHSGHDPTWRVFEEFAAPLQGRRTMR